MILLKYRLVSFDFKYYEPQYNAIFKDYPPEWMSLRYAILFMADPAVTKQSDIFVCQSDSLTR